MSKVGILTLIALLGFLATAFKSETLEVQRDIESLTWYANLDEANEVAVESGRPIFGFFTGSDWCGWCHKLQREIFAKEAFVEWANEKVVLLELDFPRRKKLPEDLAKQNRELQQAFKVTGYPTVWIFRAEKDDVTRHFNLTALGKLGYPRGAEVGKEEVKFIADADKVLANDTKK